MHLAPLTDLLTRDRVYEVDQIAERLREYEAVGVERAMLQHLVHEDVEMIGRLGELAAALR